jgi:uncharacterized SAM-binding protein YcdF (DUF218 family)
MTSKLTAQSAEAIIVLGHESKRKLSSLCIKRLEKAIKLYSKKELPIIFSGGYSLKNKRGEGPSEAELMKNYAIKKGVSLSNILLEEKSRDTQGNAYFTKQILKKKGWKKVLVITSDFHLLKTKFFFDFIYGPKFKISYMGVKSDFSKKEIKEKERKSIDVMIKIYKEKDIKQGEDEKIGEILKTFYAKFN